jgi:hypothetical protein
MGAGNQPIFFFPPCSLAPRPRSSGRQGASPATCRFRFVSRTRMVMVRLVGQAANTKTCAVTEHFAVVLLDPTRGWLDLPELCVSSPAAKAPRWPGFMGFTGNRALAEKLELFPRPKAGITFAIAAHFRLPCAGFVSVRQERRSSTAGPFFFFLPSTRCLCLFA